MHFHQNQRDKSAKLQCSASCNVLIEEGSHKGMLLMQYGEANITGFTNYFSIFLKPA